MMNDRKETRRYYDATARQSFIDWFDNSALVPTLRTFISHLPAQPFVLDLGCGTGGESQRLSTLGANVMGIDFSEESIKYAREHAPAVRFMVMDILDMDFPADCFDGIVEAGVLFHFTKEEQDRILRKLFSYVKLNGRFLSYYPEGTFEGMQARDVSGVNYRRFARQLPRQKWIDQVIKIGFHKIQEYDFNIASFKCIEFSK